VSLPARERWWTTEPPPGSPPEQSLDDFLEERAFHNRLHQEYARQTATPASAFPG
jgi:hypothetical protein